MVFQERLRYYREKKGYKTAKEFSEAIRIPYSRYLNYENKGQEPKFDTLVKIADSLGITVDDLLGHIPTVVYSDSIPKEVADLISRKAEEVKQQYIRDCLEMYSHYRKKVQE